MISFTLLNDYDGEPFNDFSKLCILRSAYMILHWDGKGGGKNIKKGRSDVDSFFWDIRFMPVSQLAAVIRCDVLVRLILARSIYLGLIACVANFHDAYESIYCTSSQRKSEIAYIHFEFLIYVKIFKFQVSDSSPGERVQKVLNKPRVDMA